jgi:hypothetical protein
VRWCVLAYACSTHRPLVIPQSVASDIAHGCPRLKLWVPKPSHHHHHHHHQITRSSYSINAITEYMTAGLSFNQQLEIGCSMQAGHLGSFGPDCLRCCYGAISGAQISCKRVSLNSVACGGRRHAPGACHMQQLRRGGSCTPVAV